MTKVLATVGYRPQKVTASLRHEPNVSSVLLFVGSLENQRTSQAVRAIQRAARALAIPCRVEKTSDPYGFDACVQAYAEAVKPVGGDDAVFNISGGTGVMQAAATIVCALHGMRMAYYNDEQDVYVRLPAFRLPILRLSPLQLRLLGTLHKAPLRTSAWAGRANLPSSHLAYHASRLKQAGFVHKTGPTRLDPWRLTALGRIFVP